jgi:competence protein ComEC
MAPDKGSRLKRARAWAIPLAGDTGASRIEKRSEWFVAFSSFLTVSLEAEWEARRYFLWLAPLTFSGVLLYFAADEEPALWAGPSLGILAASSFWLVRDRGRLARGLCLSVLAASFGFSVGSIRTHFVDAPILKDTVLGQFSATIETIDWSEKGARLQLRDFSIRREIDGNWPYRVRASLAGHPSIQPGDRISGVIRLQPPPFPARPGGYDFARDAYFARIGGVGSILGTVMRQPDAEPTGFVLLIMSYVDRGRIALTERIYRSIGGQSGAVTAALFTGKRGYITDATNDALRAAGIYHVISISGLHMVLVAGMVFGIFRLVFALIPGLALVYPVKRWSAALAMIGALAYDIFAGSEVATERSLVMVLIMFGAILLGRRALSMRNLVIASLVIMVIEPESLLGPSFQMSFAAVAALVAAFEKVQRPSEFQADMAQPISGPRPKGPPPSMMDRLIGWIVSHVKTVFLTTVLCEAATGPFSAFHFQRIQPLGMIGNGLTIPLVEGLAMPIGFFGVLAIPFGLDRYFWQAAGYCVSAMLWVSDRVATIPFATHTLPAISLAAVLWLVFGMCWILLWSTRLRFFGILPVFIGLVIGISAQKADIVVARDGQGLAARGPDGQLAVMGKGTSAFVVAQWLAADGDMRQPNDPTLKQSPLCDATGCVSKLPHNGSVFLTLRTSDLSEDCEAAKVLVTPLQAPADCAALTIDKPMLQARGSIELVPDTKGSYFIRGARTPDYNRPWSLKPVKPANPVQLSEPDDPTIIPIQPR